MSHYFNTASQQAPALVATLNLLSITGPSKCEAGVDTPKYRLFAKQKVSSQHRQQLRQDGFQAVQGHLLFPSGIEAFNEDGFIATEAAIVKQALSAKQIEAWQKAGVQAATLILGTGQESFEEALNKCKQVLALSDTYNFPLYIELHRASVTQSITQVLALCEALPELKLNADFSHYLVAYKLDSLEPSELEALLAIMQPIFARVAYLHLRFADSEHAQCMQTSEWAEQVYHHLVYACIEAFQSQAEPGDILFLAPELLPSFTGYGDMQRSVAGHRETQCRYQAGLSLLEKLCSKPQAFKCKSAAAVQTSQSECAELTIAELRLSSVSAWQAFDFTALDGVDRIDVSLGSQLLQDEQVKSEILRLFVQKQQEDARYLLKTSRGTLAHSLQDTQALLQQYPDLKLSLDASEWLIAGEIRIEQLLKFYRQLKALRMNIGALVQTYATAEYLYPRGLHYKPMAFMNVHAISVIIELFYTVFWRILFRQFKPCSLR